MIYQLLLLPPHSRQQQQQQQGQLPLLGSWTLISSSMDRSLAVSHIALQDATPPAAAAAAGVIESGAAGAVGVSANSGRNSSSNMTLDILEEPDATTSSSSSSSAKGLAKVNPKPNQKSAAAGSGAVQFVGVGPNGVAVTAEGCKVTWQFSGLGGHVYCTAVQPCFADALLPPPAYSPVKVAVGCGDKTIRVMTLGVRKADGNGGGGTTAPGGSTVALGSSTAAAAGGNKLTGISRSSSSSNCLTSLGDASGSSSSTGSAAAAAAGNCGSSNCGSVDAAVVTAAGTDAASLCWNENSSSSSTSTSSSSSEVRAAALQSSVLLWSNVSDIVTALSWHPTNPRRLKMLQDKCMLLQVAIVAAYINIIPAVTLVIYVYVAIHALASSTTTCYVCYCELGAWLSWMLADRWSSNESALPSAASV